MANKPYERMRAFIVTPFDKKPDAEGRIIDFDAVRKQLIEPALDRLGLTGRTTGEIVKAGNIHADMFQRLLTADLVVAEVSIHNANVFYELGIRHALRPQRTFMLRSKGDKYPFDLETYRYMTYDREAPAAAVDELVAALRATLDSTDQDSPVFRSLPGLREQEHSHFLPVPVDFREEVELAQARKQRGDLNLLAMETQGFQWGGEGLRVVGRAQFKLKDYAGARETWEKIRDDHPDDKEACILLSSIYQRLGDLTRSDQMLKRVLTHPDTTPYERAEAYTLMGRNAKTLWIADWEGDDKNPIPAQVRPQNALQSRYLEESFSLCEKGFGEDLNHFYSGLNALAMLKVRIDLATQLGAVWSEGFEDDDKAAAALAALNRQFNTLAPSVALSITAAKERLKREIDAAKDPGQRGSKTDELNWAMISEADHGCLTSKRPNLVKTAYRNALSGVADFYSDAAFRQLVLYKALGVLGDNVAAALEVAQPKPNPPKPAVPHVLVFTGHRIDDQDREAKGLGKRFPRNMEATAREAVKAAVSKELALAGGQVVGVAGGASGGDIIFHEVCAELNTPTLLYLALPRDQYLVESVQGGGPDWMLRFNTLHDARERFELSRSTELPRWLREKAGYNIWQRSNLWILSNALDKAEGGSHLTLIALWNGKQGDAAGGTEDMVSQAQRRGARTIILPTEKLFGLDGG
ncbi:MAG TPA: tetratricopeptide repeat-containing protein [Candidatus Acidoferrum sp.]|nr:tetratricopeptide repeat-containing protein [Candidatus Acidoferrum sp.]